MEKWTRFFYQPCLPLGKEGRRVTGSQEHIELSRRAASEGMVLLKNQGDLLPFHTGQKLAVFGKACVDYVKGGGGTISNSGLTEVPVGGSFTAKLTPNEGYEIKSVTVNGKEVKVSNGKISFENLSENLVIEARFSPIPGVTPPVEPENPVNNGENQNNNSRPSAGGSENEIIDNETPDDGNDETSDGSKTQTVRRKIVTEEIDVLMTVLLIAGIVLLIIAAGIILYFIIKKKKKDRKEANLQ